MQTDTPQPDPARKLIEHASTDRTVADLPERLDGETAIERVLRARGKTFARRVDVELDQDGDR